LIFVDLEYEYVPSDGSHAMPDRVPIDRRLTDPERELLAYLSASTVAEQTGITLAAAGAVLKELAGRGLVIVHGDALDVYLTVDGTVLVHATREWLAFQAMADELDDAPPAVGRLFDDA
jgi:hypothetical protein